MNIEESIKPLRILMSKYKQIDEMNNFDHELALVIDYTELSAIETLLTAYEKEKGENVKLRLQDIPLMEGELKAYKDRVNELKQELEKEKEKNKDLKEGYKIQEHNYQVAMEEIEQRWKDKIKAKIEECENKIKKIRSKKLINEPEDTIVITRYAHYISVLQSLLEKE